MPISRSLGRSLSPRKRSTPTPSEAIVRFFSNGGWRTSCVVVSTMSTRYLGGHGILMSRLWSQSTPLAWSPKPLSFPPNLGKGGWRARCNEQGKLLCATPIPLTGTLGKQFGSDRASRLPWSSRKAGTVEGTQPMGALLCCSAHARQISIKSRPSRKEPTPPRIHELNSLAEVNAAFDRPFILPTRRGTVKWPARAREMSGAF